MSRRARYAPEQSASGVEDVRGEVHLPVRVAALDGRAEQALHGLVLTGHTLDVSAGGARLALPGLRTPPVVGARLYVEIELPDAELAPGRGRGRPAADGALQVRFLDLAPLDRDRLAGLVFEAERRLLAERRRPPDVKVVVRPAAVGRVRGLRDGHSPLQVRDPVRVAGVEPGVTEDVQRLGPQVLQAERLRHGHCRARELDGLLTPAGGHVGAGEVDEGGGLDRGRGCIPHQLHRPLGVLHGPLALPQPPRHTAQVRLRLGYACGRPEPASRRGLAPAAAARVARPGPPARAAGADAAARGRPAGRARARRRRTSRGREGVQAGGAVAGVAQGRPGLLHEGSGALAGGTGDLDCRE